MTRDDDRLHGIGRRIKHDSEGVPIQTAHSPTVCGQSGCGKTVWILDLLEGPYRGLSLTMKHKKTNSIPEKFLQSEN